GPGGGGGTRGGHGGCSWGRGGGPRRGGWARRYVQVEPPMVERVVGHTELVRVRPHERQRNLRRLRHHLTELACHLHAGLAVHRGDFDREHVAAHTGDRQTGREAGGRCAHRVLRGKARPADAVVQV